MSHAELVHAERQALQQLLQGWCATTFGKEHAESRRIRALRFLEEAIELVQAQGLDHHDVAFVSDYVFGRPVGQTPQEVGGVMIALNCLCENLGLSIDTCERNEASRVLTVDPEKLRAKQALKTAEGLI